MKILFPLIMSLSFHASAIGTQSMSVNYKVSKFLVNNSCTGSYVNIEGETYFTTAAHCFSKRMKKKKVKTYKLNSKLKRVKSTKKTVEVTNNKYFSFDGDRVVIKVNNSNSGVKTLKHASGLPGLGETLYALGYPRGNGYLFSRKLSCKYLGSGDYYTEDTPLTIGRLMKCYTNLNTIQGMSGGPIVNENGEFVGVLSAEVQPPKNKKFKGARYIYVFFNEIYNGEILTKETQREVGPYNKYVEEDFKFIPFDL